MSSWGPLIVHQSGLAGSSSDKFICKYILCAGHHKLPAKRQIDLDLDPSVRHSDMAYNCKLKLISAAAI